MASRTKQKEEARARRLAEEKVRAERDRRQRRMRIVLGIVVGAAAVVAVVVAISLGGNKSSGLETGSKSAQTVASVEKLLTGIPQSGARLGNPKAPVTMTYYGDLECPICRDFTLSSFPQLVAKDVRDGKVQVVYKGFQTATPSPQTFQTQQAAALAAGEQNRFWNYVELFYHEQGAEGTGYVNENYLSGLAKQVPGLAVNNWTSARNNAQLVSQVQTDEQSASSAGVSATPTLVISGPKGKSTPSAAVPSYSQLEAAIHSVQ
jgi:protein-disulfide isomerase